MHFTLTRVRRPLTSNLRSPQRYSSFANGHSETSSPAYVCCDCALVFLRGIGSVTSRGREMDELRARLAQVELERDQAVADFNRRNAQLAQMEETQRTLHEHLYILKTKYETAKVRTPRPVTSAWALS